MKNQVNSEDKAEYRTTTSKMVESENRTIAKAIKILEARARVPGAALDSPDATRDMLRLKLAGYKAECFVAVFTDNRHRVIAYREMFNGTIDGASVHPREVVRAAIEENAAAVIFAHNHPSGNPEPSQADIRITSRLKDALSLIDVRVLDHMVVGSHETVSLAERGLI